MARQGRQSAAWLGPAGRGAVGHGKAGSNSGDSFLRGNPRNQTLARSINRVPRIERPAIKTDIGPVTALLNLFFC